MNKPLCRVCQARPVTSKGKGVLRDICWKCHRPSRAQNSVTRKRKRLELMDKCAVCGFVPKDVSEIDIDHIDGNRRNEAPDNIQVLCRPCHIVKTVASRDYLPLRKRGVER